MRSLPFLAAALVLASQVHATTPSHLKAPYALTVDASTNPLAVTSEHPQLSWKLEASALTLRNVHQSAYRILAATSRALLNTKPDLWDSTLVTTSNTLNIPYTGKPLAPTQQVFWKVISFDERHHASPWSATQTFTTAPALSPDRQTFPNAHWITSSTSTERDGADAPMPVLRTQFPVHKTIARALLQITGLGQYQASINQHTINPDTLSPGWSDYKKTIFFDTYDVTSSLAQGPNTLTLLLGNGMYNVQKATGRFTKFTGSFGPPKAIAALQITFTDGTSTTITTNHTWQSAPGPITLSTTYGGEDYNATLSPLQWQPAKEVDGPGGRLTPEIAPPITTQQTYTPIHTTHLSPTRIVYDLGQNFAGYPSISIEGPANSTLRLTPGELLNPDGTVSQASEGGGHRGYTYFIYTLSGHSPEHYHPLFTYYGFRYVQVDLTPAPDSAQLPHLISLTGLALHSDSPATGSVHTSSDLLNRIHHLILMAMQNNTVSLFTDCPHREKLGWLEEDQLVASPMLFNTDLRNVYAATFQNIADAQLPSGEVPNIAPQYTVFKNTTDAFNDSPEWGSTSILAPFTLYQRFGDLRTLRDNYPVMQRYIAYLQSRTHDNILAYGLGDWYDIGPGSPGFSKLTSLGVTATATLYQDLLAMQATAQLLNDPTAANTYAQQAEQIKQAFNQKFFNTEKHVYDTGSQTAQAMPLALNMVPEQHREQILNALIADIHAHNNHVTTGEIGFPYLVRALMQSHRDNVLLDIMQRTDAPSYGAQLAAGATSLTEAWDANPHSSQDHFMLGYGDDFFFTGLAGLHLNFADTSTPIRINPAMPQGVTSASATYNSVAGPITSAWARTPTTTTLNITIPANTQAELRVDPSAHEHNNAAVKASGVLSSHTEASDLYLRIGSGHYTFTWPTRAHH
ncbi:MAG: family 78 glycoside hydrolase catalytic domain [Acidobacteriota bacterium]